MNVLIVLADRQATTILASKLLPVAAFVSVIALSNALSIDYTIASKQGWSINDAAS